MKTRTENWRGYSIRFVEIDNAWWAVLKDICDALNLSTWKVAQRLEPNMLEKVSIEADLPSSPVTSKKRRAKVPNDAHYQRNWHLRSIVRIS